jgi:hypothetical protein
MGADLRRQVAGAFRYVAVMPAGPGAMIGSSRGSALKQDAIELR